MSPPRCHLYAAAASWTGRSAALARIDELKERFGARADVLLDAAAQGPERALGFVMDLADPEDRLALALFARRALVLGDHPNLDAYAAVARAGIDEAIACSQPDTANVIAYNLAADLADCWPGDEIPRTRAHFETGLRAAIDCIVLREQLDKPPADRSAAWWARGIHELSLGDAPASTASFVRCLDLAAPEGVAAVSPDAPFGVLLAAGHLALARWIGGDEAGRAAFEEVRAAFGAQIDAAGDDHDAAEDAMLGREQLDKVAARYGP